MSLRKNLHRWEEAGLMHAHQAEDILAYEKERHSGVFMRGLLALGVLAILTGILSFVAANWQAIPPFVKMAVHLIINAGVAYKMYTFDRDGMKLHRELAVFVLMGLTLTLIGLTGQVFHLNGTLGGALILWAVLCTPFAVLYGRSKISLIPWLIGVLAAMYIGIFEVFNGVNWNWHTLDMRGINFASMAISVMLVLLALAARYIERETLYRLLFSTGAVISVITACASTLFFYFGFGHFLFFAERGFIIPIIGACLTAAAGIYFLKFIDRDFAPEINFISKLLLAGLAVCLLPFIIPFSVPRFINPVLFIGYWLYLGYLGQKFGELRLVTTAILMIALRVYIAYIELFGSMLLTSYGLIVSGLLLIGMVRGVMLLNKNIGTLKTGGDDDE